jgi:hypothetical protein
MAVRTASGVTLRASGLIAGVVLLGPGSARAAEDERPRSESLLDREHTVAEVEVGAIALPTAPISPSQRSKDPVFGTGDFTFNVGMHLLFRGGKSWAIGAGASFAPSPTSDDEYGGLRGLKRSHARSYLFLGVEGRYIPLHERIGFLKSTIEGWVGLRSGMIVIADRFVTEEGDRVPTILGTREVTIRTEGFSLGIQGGFTWLFSEHWLAGFTLRADRWILPTAPLCSPIGDCATLTGTVVALEAGLSLGYRIPL